jgi:hypothetical protein
LAKGTKFLQTNELTEVQSIKAFQLNHSVLFPSWLNTDTANPKKWAKQNHEGLADLLGKTFPISTHALSQLDLRKSARIFLHPHNFSLRLNKLSHPA